MSSTPNSKNAATPPTAEQVATLRAHAEQAATNAYAPYSNFYVGAALLLADGSIVAGCNVENASYRLTCCAEQSAVATAVTQHGPQMRIASVAIVNRNHTASAPCGACRQTLFEFTLPGATVIYPGEDGIAQTTTIEQLLPGGFRLERDSER